jgi:hypothetical protein
MRLDEIQDIFEAPEIVGATQFGLDVPKVNIQFARDLLSDKRTKVLDIINGNKLVQKGHEIILIDDSNPNVPKILYFVKFIVKKINYIKRNSAQVAVWRTSGSSAIGIASKIFFNYILPITGCIVTDIYQTLDGQKFWEDRISDALDAGLYVYFIDVMPPNRKIVPILNFDDLHQLKDQIWGAGQKFHERRVIITNTPVDNI